MRRDEFTFLCAILPPWSTDHKPVIDYYEADNDDLLGLNCWSM
jgi:hypothetical protein